jgi:hypothetical protein
MNRDNVIQIKSFSDVDLSDPFFDSLKDAYREFSDWFARKSDNRAYVVYGVGGSLLGFLYVKSEMGPVQDITPPLNAARVLKVGTFKIDAHGTKLGERFVKKIFDHALEEKVTHLYVTVFPEHEALISLLVNYGFRRYGTKTTGNGTEHVFVKDFVAMTGHTEKDYPIIDASKSKWLLGIKPIYHTKLFPDSILRTEDSSIVNDVSHTNSIHKIYIGKAYDMPAIRPGDVLVIYCTKQENKPGWYSSVATSLCVVEDTWGRAHFSSEQEFLQYTQRHSVYSEQELSDWYRRGGSNMRAIRMTYNVALPKRPNRQALIQQAGLDADAYWGLHRLTDQQFASILALGKVYEGVVIH